MFGASKASVDVDPSGSWFFRCFGLYGVLNWLVVVFVTVLLRPSNVKLRGLGCGIKGSDLEYVLGGAWMLCTARRKRRECSAKA